MVDKAFAGHLDVVTSLSEVDAIVARPQTLILGSNLRIDPADEQV